MCSSDLEEALRAEVADRGPADSDPTAAGSGGATQQVASGLSGLLTQLLVLPKAIAAGNQDVAYEAILKQARNIHRSVAGNDGLSLDEGVPTSPTGPAVGGSTGDAPTASSDVLPETQLRLFENLSQSAQHSSATTLVATPGAASPSPDRVHAALTGPAAAAGGSPTYAQVLTRALTSGPADALPAGPAAVAPLGATGNAVPRAMSARMRVDATAAAAKRSPAPDRRRTRHGDSSPRSPSSEQGEEPSATPSPGASRPESSLRQLDLAEVLARNRAALAELIGDAPAAEGDAPTAEGEAPSAPAPPAADPGAEEGSADGPARPPADDGGDPGGSPPRG